MSRHSRPEAPKTQAFSERSISGRPVVAVMQATQARMRNHQIRRRTTDSAAWCLFAQPEMGSVLMVVGDVLGEESSEMTLVQRDDVIE